jgi:diguanylate cyclase (GGDEF)-like protein
MTALRKRTGLQQKLVVALLLVGLLPLMTALVSSYLSQKVLLQQTMGTAFQGLAKETSFKLGLLLEEFVTVAHLLASDPAFRVALAEAIASYSPGLDPDIKLRELERRWVNSGSLPLNPRASSLLRTEGRQSPDRFGQILLVDRNGGLVAAASPPRHFRYREETWWQAAYQQGRGSVYIGDIQWDAEMGFYTLPVAVPVRHENGVLGVLLAVYKVDRLFKSVTKVHIGQSDHTMLANSNGDLLFCPIFQIRNHTLKKPLIDLIAQTEPGWVVSRVDVHYPGRDAINGFAPVRLEIAGLSRHSLGGQDWYIFTSQDPKETYGPLQTLLRWTALSALLGLGLLIGLTVLVSRRIVTPIMKLGKAARSITEEIKGLPQPPGAPLSVETQEQARPYGHAPEIRLATGDEIEELAVSFSEMTQVLSQTREQLAMITKRLEEMAITDELTGLYNRRFFWEELKAEFVRTLRFRLDLSCLVMDLDFFKEVNDQYGHQAGDRVLRDLARLLRENCREPDTLARFGGEEFIAILPQTDATGAFVQAERLRKQVENHTFRMGPDRSLKMTISIGIASYPDGRVHEIEDLVKIADDALYLSKQHGRNRVSKG